MFNRMLQRAVVGYQVFCAHDGIFSTIVILDELPTKTPYILNDPQELFQSALKIF